jgi:CheY-like chemotaxis protein
MLESNSLLMVEDDRQLSRAVSRALGRFGHSVIAAPSFATAQVLACRFDIGVFDIQLGDGDGIDLAEEMLGDGRVEHVVFFTAERDPVALERAGRLGPVVHKQEGVEALLPILRGISLGNCGPVSGIHAMLPSSAAPTEIRRVVGE